MAEICESLSIAYITVRRASNHLKRPAYLIMRMIESNKSIITD